MTSGAPLARSVPGVGMMGGADREREEVHVERVPVEGRESLEAEILVPVTEEEVVVEKQPVVKEEIRLRKEVIEEEEVIEEDVRKEDVDIEDRTRRRNNG